MNEEIRAKNESVTFRIRSSILSELRSDAEQDRTSLNTLVNRVLEEYVEWGSHASEAQLISFPRALLVDLMERLSEDDVVMTAKSIVRTEVKDIVLLMREKYDLSSFLDVVESWLKASGFPYRQYMENGFHTYVVQHDMSQKWSVYLGEVFKGVVEQFSKKLEYDVTPNTLVFKVQSD